MTYITPHQRHLKHIQEVLGTKTHKMNFSLMSEFNELEQETYDLISDSQDMISDIEDLTMDMNDVTRQYREISANGDLVQNKLLASLSKLTKISDKLADIQSELGIDFPELEQSIRLDNEIHKAISEAQEADLRLQNAAENIAKFL